MHLVGRPPSQSQIESPAASECLDALERAIAAHDRLGTPASRNVLRFASRQYLAAAGDDSPSLRLFPGGRGL